MSPLTLDFSFYKQMTTSERANKYFQNILFNSIKNNVYDASTLQLILILHHYKFLWEMCEAYLDFLGHVSTIKTTRKLGKKLDLINYDRTRTI